MGKGFSYPFEISLLSCGNGLEKRGAWFHLRVGTLGEVTKCPTSTYVHVCVYTHIGVCYVLMPICASVVSRLRLPSVDRETWASCHLECLVAVIQIIAQKPCDVQCATGQLL